MCPAGRRVTRFGFRGLTALLAVVLASCAGSGSDSARTTTTARSDPTSTQSDGMGPGSTTATSSSSSPPSQAAPCTQSAKIAAWPIQARASQLIVVPSLDFNVADLSTVLQTGVGGVLFLGREPAPPDLSGRIAVARKMSVVPPSFLADQEGGGVQRMKGLVDPIPWPRTMAATMDPAQVEVLAKRTGTQLLAAGVDVDLAPVLDVDARPGPSESNPDGQRSFGGTAAAVSAPGLAFIRGLTSSGVVPVAKHFPGLGGSTVNSDFGSAATRPIAALRRVDLLPFRDAIEAGVPAIMVANASVPGLTDQPAVLSTAVVQDLLRGELGFKGAVITDSLSARSISEAGLSLPEAAVASVRSGADQILFGSTLDAHELALLEPDAVAASAHEITAALVAAVGNGTLPESRLDEAVAHVLELKGIDLCRASPQQGR